MHHLAAGSDSEPVNPRSRISVRQRYVDAICRSAESDRGAPLIDATKVVAAAAREGSTAALDRHDAGDVARIAAFVSDCTQDDLDEAELDPVIVAVLDAAGAIAAYASARPWSFDGDFDDIAVITHPARCGEGLRATAVRALVARQQPTGRLMFHNCDVENRGSDAVAETLGFELVSTVAAVSFT